jgi:hypothetical protein
MKSKTKPGATVFLGGAELMNYLVTTAFQVSSLHNLAQAQKKKDKRFQRTQSEEECTAMTFMPWSVGHHAVREQSSLDFFQQNLILCSIENYHS